MATISNTSIFPIIQTFEDFEKLKLEPEIFENAVREIAVRHGLPVKPFTVFLGTNFVCSYGSDRVIKIFPPEHQHQFASDVLVMKHLHNKLSVNTPEIEYEGEIDGWPYIVMSKLDGTLLEGLWEKLDHENKAIILRELGALIREVHSLPTAGLEAIDCHWQEFIAKQIKQCVATHKAYQLTDKLLQEIPQYLKAVEVDLLQITNPVLLTGEYTPMNFLVKQEGGIWHIHGLIDFGDAMLGLPEYDLLGPAAFLIQGDKRLSKEFLAAYGYQPHEMTAKLSHKLTALMLLHLYSNLNNFRIANWKSTVDLQDLENIIWGLR